MLLKDKVLHFLEQNNKIVSIISTLQQAGARIYLVGGVVRDMVLQCQTKDIDIEVHGISIDELENVLKSFGPVKLVGKQFGVLRLLSLDIDWSLPRKDSKGRKPKVIIDPEMTIEQACRRRDVTMNAMAIDLGAALSKKEIKLIDPFDGLNDISSKTLRAVDATLFVDDPLRFYRVMQFIGRFEMDPDKELNELCLKIDVSDVARERIFEELKKLLLQSKNPSRGIRWLNDIGRLKEVMPEVYELIGVVQPKKYHPEGDVFEHTMQSLDAAAILDMYENDREKLLIMFGALCHDFGKPAVTDKEGHARGHEEKGVEPTKIFLKRFCDDTLLIKVVTKLVRHHLMPGALIEQKSSVKAYKRLALKLSPEVSMRQLGMVALCDHRGRNGKGHDPLDIDQKLFDAFAEKLKEADVVDKPEAPVLQGRHIIDDIKSGPAMGRLLKRAYEIQIDEGIINVDELKRRVLKK
jgi:tRNA nucleotidyltransferase (CCA-adding enzyme)